MQSKGKDKRRVLRTNASITGPTKVRNLKTGELAIYTPDRLQPTIPVGWVPLNSGKKQNQPKFTINRGLIVQTKGNQYRILNSSRQVIACGRLNADVDDQEWKYEDFATDDEFSDETSPESEVNSTALNLYDDIYANTKESDPSSRTNWWARYYQIVPDQYQEEYWEQFGLTLDDAIDEVRTFEDAMKRLHGKSVEVKAYLEPKDETYEPLSEEGLNAPVLLSDGRIGEISSALLGNFGEYTEEDVEDAIRRWTGEDF